MTICVGCETGNGGGLPPVTQPTQSPPSDDDTVSDVFVSFDVGMQDTRQDVTPTPSCSFSLNPLVLDNCTGNQICVTNNENDPGRCEGAFGRLYSIGLGSVIIPERNAEGDCWDIGCGAPDPFIAVFLDGEVVLRTSTSSDVFQVQSISETASFLLRENSTVDIILYDEDLSSNDTITGCRLNPVTSDQLRLRLLQCGDANLGFLFALVMN